MINVTGMSHLLSIFYMMISFSNNSHSTQIVDKKAKEQILKRWLQENKARTCAYLGVRYVSFSENLRLLCFILTTILRFTLLVLLITNCTKQFTVLLVSLISQC